MASNNVSISSSESIATPVFPTIANTWDSNFYHETATSLAEGNGFTFQEKPTAYYPPGYPLWIALGYKIAGVEGAPTPR